MDQHRCCYLVVYKRVDTRASLYLLDYSLHVFICWASCNSQGQKSRLCHTKSGIDLLAFRNIKYPFIFSPVIIPVMVPWPLRPHQALESLLLSYEAAASSGLLHFIRALGVLFFCYVSVIFILSSCMQLSSMTNIWTYKQPLFRPAHSLLLPIKCLLPCHVAYMSGRLSLLPGLNMCMRILNSSQFAC